MAEVEIACAKIKGGKILLILPILGTLGGGLWGGFEFYKDYMNMRERIESYEAPDLSGFDKKLAVLHEEMASLKTEMAAVVQLEKVIKESADDARDYTKDIKRDLKDEMHHMSKQVDDRTLLLFWEFSVETINEINLVSNQNLAIEMFLIRLLYVKNFNPKNTSHENISPDVKFEKNLSTNQINNKNFASTIAVSYTHLTLPTKA